jgi:hypothetical protein
VCRVPREVVRGAAVCVLDAGAQFRAARRGAFAVVVGPGEVEADGVGLDPGGGRPEPMGQFGGAFGGVALFAEHDVEAVAEGVAASGPGVVGGEGGVVQGAGALGLLGRGGRAVGAVEVMSASTTSQGGTSWPSRQARMPSGSRCQKTAHQPPPWSSFAISLFRYCANSRTSAGS